MFSKLFIRYPKLFQLSLKRQLASNCFQPIFALLPDTKHLSKFVPNICKISRKTITSRGAESGEPLCDVLEQLFFYIHMKALRRTNNEV